MHGLFARSLAAGLAIPLGLAIAGGSACFAQISSGTQRTLNAASQGAAKPQVAPPPVLPGTKTAPEAAAPSVLPADMSPTDALFDAVNRGDLAAARDAVNRGADLNAPNILGLTPLELSVDLGRNNISFMLLSMRDEDASSRATARRGGNLSAASQGDAAGSASAVLRTAGRSRVMAASARPPDEPVAETPRFYSGNGGAPIPAAGFLGFDTGRAAR